MYKRQGAACFCWQDGGWQQCFSVGGTITDLSLLTEGTEFYLSCVILPEDASGSSRLQLFNVRTGQEAAAPLTAG